MRRVQAGGFECFAELALRYESAMLRVACSRLGRRELAEDCVQESFMAAFKWRDTYDPHYSFRTWLWTILLNQCRGIARRSARLPRVSSWSDATGAFESNSMTADSLTCREPEPENHLLATEQRERLDLLLGRLSPAQADALRLRFFGALKYQEIADTMDCSLGTAKNRVRWGLLRMADLTSSDSALDPDPTAGNQGVQS